MAGSLASAGDYQVGPGDSLSVHVHDETELSRRIVVGENCRIDVGLIGAVEACDLTVDAIAKSIEARLADGFLVNPQVTVEIAQYGSQFVQVAGEVKRPGEVVLDGPKTLLEVILAAGDRSGENVVDVKLVRGGDVQRFNIEMLPAQDPIYVQAGDVVVVESPRFVYVNGGVKKDGPVDFRDGLTVSQAYSSAGGRTEFARMRQAYIKRGEDRIDLNMRRILDGKDADMVLEPEDILVIPSNGD